MGKWVINNSWDYIVRDSIRYLCITPHFSLNQRREWPEWQIPSLSIISLLVLLNIWWHDISFSSTTGSEATHTRPFQTDVLLTKTPDFHLRPVPVTAIFRRMFRATTLRRTNHAPILYRSYTLLSVSRSHLHHTQLDPPSFPGCAWSLRYVPHDCHRRFGYRIPHTRPLTHPPLGVFTTHITLVKT